MSVLSISEVKKYISEADSILRETVLIGKKDLSHFKPEKYFGTTLHFLGLSMPALRAVYKNGFLFSALPVEHQLIIYKKIWESTDVYEMRFLCIFFLTQYYRKLQPELVLETIDAWMENVDCWPHSDDIAKVTCLVSEKIPEEYRDTILRWNVSKNSWKRRQSMVALVRDKSAYEKVFTSTELEKLFTRLLHDKVYMVQKGLGWALRDTGRKNPVALVSFLRKYCTEMTSAAFTTAIEKLNKNEKEYFKAMRKDSRTR